LGAQNFGTPVRKITRRRLSLGKLLLPFLLTLFPLESLASQVPVREAIEELRLGGLSAVEATAFVTEPKLDVDWVGNIYARTQTEVRVFGRDGSLSHILGGKGDGPGEFRSAFALGMLGDTVWVIDPQFHPSRITRFLSDGRLVGTSPSEERPYDDDGSRSWRVTHLLQGGNVLATANSNPGVPTRLERVEIPMGIADAQLSDPKVIARIEWPQGLFIPEVVQAGLGPFPSSPLYAVYPDGSGVVRVEWDPRRPGSPVKIQVYDAAGKRKFEVVHVVPYTPLLDRVVDSLVADGVEKVTPIIERRRERGLPVPSNLKRAVKDGLRVPRAFPIFQEVIAGVDGSIWLRRMSSFSDNTWFVLDSRGTPAFQVELPEGVNVQQATFDNVWGTALGEYDAPLILRFGVRR
jgi:hypothetical protein